MVPAPQAQARSPLPGCEALLGGFCMNDMTEVSLCISLQVIQCTTVIESLKLPELKRLVRPPALVLMVAWLVLFLPTYASHLPFSLCIPPQVIRYHGS
jgi:hypothetical protein